MPGSWPERDLAYRLLHLSKVNYNDTSRGHRNRVATYFSVSSQLPPLSKVVKSWIVDGPHSHVQSVFELLESVNSGFLVLGRGLMNDTERKLESLLLFIF